MPPINMRNLPDIEAGLNDLTNRMKIVMETKDATTVKIKDAMFSIGLLIKQLYGCGELRKQIEALKQQIAQLESDAATSQTNIDGLNSRIKSSYDTLAKLIAEYEQKNAEFNEFAPAQFEKIRRDLESILQVSPQPDAIPNPSSELFINEPTQLENTRLEVLPEYNEFNSPEEYITDVKGLIDINKGLRELFAKLDLDNYKLYEYFKREYNNTIPRDKVEELKNYATSMLGGGRRRKCNKSCKSFKSFKKHLNKSYKKGGYHYSSNLSHSLTKKVKKHKHRRNKSSKSSKNSKSNSNSTSNKDNSKSSNSYETGGYLP